MQGPLDDISTSGQLGDWGVLRKKKANRKEAGGFLSLGQVVGSWRESDYTNSASPRRALPGSLLSKRSLNLAATTDSK